MRERDRGVQAVMTGKVKGSSLPEHNYKQLCATAAAEARVQRPICQQWDTCNFTEVSVWTAGLIFF